MKFLDIVTKLFDPIAKVIDETHTSTEEKMEARRKLFEAQSVLFMAVIDYEKNQLEAKAKIITAEAQGQSWIQRSWRPITMLTFLVLVCLDSFGVLAFRLSENAWTLLQLGLGGYVVGRSAEKIADKYSPAFNDNKKD